MRAGGRENPLRCAMTATLYITSILALAIAINSVACVTTLLIGGAF